MNNDFTISAFIWGEKRGKVHFRTRCEALTAASILSQNSGMEKAQGLLSVLAIFLLLLNHLFLVSGFLN